MAAPLNQQNNPDESRCCPAASALSAHLLFWSLLVAGVILDLWSKSAVFAWLESRGQTGFTIIDGFLRLQLAENSGAAFGMAAGHRIMLIAVSAVALIVLLAIFLFSVTDRKITHVALALFAAGVCGNLYDRIFNNGLVRDFIDVYWQGKHWPAFNVADSLLCVAVGLLILSGFTGPQSCQKPAQPQK